MGLLRSRSSALFLVMVFVLGAWAAATLRFDTQFLQILPGNLPSVQGLADFAKAAAGRETFFVVTDPALPRPDRERILGRLRPALEKSPRVAQLEAPGEAFLKKPGEIAAWMLVNADPEVFSKALEALDPSRMKTRLAGVPERLRGALDPAELMRAQWDPLGVLDFQPENTESGAGFPDGIEASFLIGRNAHPEEGTAGDCALLDELVRIAGECLGDEDHKHVLFTGDAIFNAQISRQTRGDVHTMVTVGLVLLAAAFYLFYRTLVPLPWIFFFQGVTLLCGLVAARLFFGHLNVISIGFGSILLGVGMDYHILVYHHFGSPNRGDAAVWRTLRRSIWFSALVTAASFFLLGFSGFPGLRQMGLLVGTGLLSTALCATWLLSKVLAAKPPSAPPIVFSASGAFARSLGRHGRALRWAACLGGLALLAVQPWKNPAALYNPDMETLQPSGISAFEGHRWLQQHDPAADDAVSLLRSDDAAALRSVARELDREFSGKGLKLRAWGIPDSGNLSTNLGRWRAGIPGEVRKAFSESELGEEWSRATFQFVETLDAAARGESRAFDGARALMRTQSGSDERGFYALARVGPVAADTGWVDRVSALDNRVRVLPVNWGRLKGELTALAQGEFAWLGSLMLGAVVLLCWVAQRSLRLVFLNLLALVLSLGIFTLLLLVTGTSLTPLTVVSLPLLLGLVIDYSLHLLMALEEHRGDLPKTFEHLAAPVLLTGLSASVGFGAPMLTNQPAMRNFGLVMDLGILSAVAACLVFLPAFYSVLRPARDYRERLFYRALYTPIGFKIIVWGWRWCGGWICRQVARVIGLGYALTHRKTVEAVRQNLALVNPAAAGFGDACGLFMNLAEGFTQYGRLATHPPEEVLKWIGNASGLDHLREVLRQDTGCLLVTGHFGFFEFGGLLLSQMGFPVTAITMPEPSSALTEWRAEFRRRWGVETIVIGNGSFAALDVVRAIHNKRFVALLVDRPMDAQTVPVDLPHGQMLFSTGPALVALLAKCPVVPVTILQEPGGRFEMVATGVIQPEWLPEGRAASLEKLTRQIAAQLLPHFQAHPKQWYHFHSLRHQTATPPEKSP